MITRESVQAVIDAPRIFCDDPDAECLWGHRYAEGDCLCPGGMQVQVLLPDVEWFADEHGIMLPRVEGDETIDTGAMKVFGATAKALGMTTQEYAIWVSETDQEGIKARFRELQEEMK